MNILYEDNDIVVCIKPYGVISQSSPDGNDMVNMLSVKLGCGIFPVHRLDKETGGLIIFAKNQNAAAKLCADISNRKINKEYLALIHGCFDSEEGELYDLIFRDKNRNKSYVVKRQRKGVKEAILKYFKLNTIEVDGNLLSLMKISLVTGRTHQIRVQFSSRGYPLAGDRRYGAKDSFKNLGLWSYSLEFYHPVTNEKMNFKYEPYDGIFNSVFA